MGAGWMPPHTTPTHFSDIHHSSRGKRISPVRHAPARGSARGKCSGKARAGCRKVLLRTPTHISSPVRPPFLVRPAQYCVSWNIPQYLGTMQRPGGAAPDTGPARRPSYALDGSRPGSQSEESCEIFWDEGRLEGLTNLYHLLPPVEPGGAPPIGMTQQIMEEFASPYSSRAGNSDVVSPTMSSPRGGPRTLPSGRGRTTRIGNNRINGGTSVPSKRAGRSPPGGATMAARQRGSCPKQFALGRSDEGQEPSSQYTAEDIDEALHCPAEDDNRSPILKRRIAFSPIVAPKSPGAPGVRGSSADAPPAADTDADGRAFDAETWTEDDLARIDLRVSMAQSHNNHQEGKPKEAVAPSKPVLPPRAPPQDAARTSGGDTCPHDARTLDGGKVNVVPNSLSPGDDLHWTAEDLAQIDRLTANAIPPRPIAPPVLAEPANVAVARGEFSQDDDPFHHMDFAAIDRQIASVTDNPAGRERGEFSQDDDAFDHMDFAAIDSEIRRHETSRRGAGASSRGTF